MSNGATPAGNEVALIAGPTASGKSDLAVELALALRAEGRDALVLNADSAQVYADLCVLSARPSAEEMRGVEHRLFGAWDGAVACSAADWAHAARREIREAHAAGRVPILVGGTGMYLKVLLEGIAEIPPIDPRIREEVRALPTEEAFKALQAEDGARAEQLAAGDSQRIARALEVVRSTGRTLAEWQQDKQGGIADSIRLWPLVLMPPRATVYERCDRRFEAMIEHGAVEEVQALLERGLDPSLPVMRAIGVPEIAGYLRGEWSLADALARGQQATRNYAKRQFTWLRHQPPHDWKREAPENVTIRSQFGTLLRN